MATKIIKLVSKKIDLKGLVVTEEECKYSQVMTACLDNKDDVNEIQLLAIHSYISCKICIEYLKICSRYPEGKEIAGPEIKSLTEDKYESLLPPEEVDLIRAIEVACNNNVVRILRVLGLVSQDANYLGMHHFVTKVCAVISIVMLHVDDWDTIRKNMSTIDIPSDIEYKTTKVTSHNLIDTIDGLDSRINRANPVIITNEEKIKPLDDSDADNGDDEPSLSVSSASSASSSAVSSPEVKQRKKAAPVKKGKKKGKKQSKNRDRR